MNPPSVPNESVTAPAKTRRLPIFIVLGSILIVVIVIVVFVIASLPRLRSTDQASPPPQFYVILNSGNSDELKIAALNVHDGSMKWTSHENVSAGSLLRIQSNTVAFADGERTLHVLNAVTGATLWSWKNAFIDYGRDSTHLYLGTVGPISNSPDIGQISALNIQNGHEDWHITVSQSAAIVVADDIPYLLGDTLTGHSYLARLDPKTGAAVWRNQAITDRLGDIVGPYGNTIYALGQTTSYALDVNTGNVRWQSPVTSVKGSVQAVIACGQENVCLVQRDGSVTAVNAMSGKQQWQYVFNHPTDPGEFSFGVLFGVDDNFIVIHTAKNIVVIHRNDGSLAWEKTLIGSNSTASNRYPLGNGIMYVNVYSSSTDNLHPVTTTAFDVATGRTLWQSPTSDQRSGLPILLGNTVITANGSVITAYAAKTGQVLWNKQFASQSDLMGVGTISLVVGAVVP